MPPRRPCCSSTPTCAKSALGVERPAELQGWIIANRETLGDEETFRHKMEWYDRDAGAATLEETVALIEAAAKR